MKTGFQHCCHSFPAFYPEDSTLLILGSFPSVASREQSFYYAHPQNRFWKLLGLVYQEDVGGSVAEKKAFLSRHHLALFDVIESCDIHGSSDASIRKAVPTDLSQIPAKVKRIILNGHLAASLFERYQSPKPGIEVVILPSTSPANAAYSLSDLRQEWASFLLDN